MEKSVGEENVGEEKSVEGDDDFDFLYPDLVKPKFRIKIVAFICLHFRKIIYDFDFRCT